MFNGRDRGRVDVPTVCVMSAAQCVVVMGGRGDTSYFDVGGIIIIYLIDYSTRGPFMLLLVDGFSKNGGIMTKKLT